MSILSHNNNVCFISFRYALFPSSFLKAGLIQKSRCLRIWSICHPKGDHLCEAQVLCLLLQAYAQKQTSTVGEMRSEQEMPGGWFQLIFGFGCWGLGGDFFTKGCEWGLVVSDVLIHLKTFFVDTVSFLFFCRDVFVEASQASKFVYSSESMQEQGERVGGIDSVHEHSQKPSILH